MSEPADTDPRSGPLLLQLKALAHPQRLRLLELLSTRGAFPDNLVDPSTVGVCVNDLAAAADLPQSTASYHLGLLRKAGLVVETQHGQWRYARPDPAAFRRLGRLVSELAD